MVRSGYVVLVYSESPRTPNIRQRVIEISSMSLAWGGYACKHEDTKKKEMQFYQKLLSDRDRAYADRIKVGLIRLLDLSLTRTCSYPATEQAEGRAVPFTGIRKL